jgi:dynein heavy chain
MMLKFVKSILESTKQFHRWLHGTCLIAPPKIVSADEEPIIYSFYDEVVANQQLIGMVSAMNHGVHKTFMNLTKYLDTWRRFRPLWKVDKVHSITLLFNRFKMINI